MTLVTIGSQSTFRELNALLGKRSGVQVVALPSKRSKPNTCDLCTTAKRFSEQAIFDLLNDLEFLLEQQERVRQRVTKRTGGRSRFVNDPRRTSNI